MNPTITLLVNVAPLLLKGTATTIGLWAGALVISGSIGIFWGMIRAHEVRVPLVSTFCDGITLVLRGVPFYVQLLIAYFVIPSLIGLPVPAYVAAIGSLGLCSAAYVSQIVSGGINAIRPQQWEAGYVLGYTKLQAFRYLIMPQVVRAVLLALCGEWDQLLKSTAVISSIGIMELTGAATNSISRTLEPLPIFLATAFIYLCMSLLLNGVVKLIERRIQL